LQATSSVFGYLTKNVMAYFLYEYLNMQYMATFHPVTDLYAV